MKWRPYPKYKPSGVEWLGDVPEHWEVKRSDFFVTTMRHQIEPKTFQGIDVFHYSIPNVQKYSSGVLENGDEIESAKQFVSKPVVLVSKLNPRKATIIIAKPHKDVLTLASTEFVAISSTMGDLRFLEYIVSSELFRQRLDSRVQSVTRSHQRARPDDIYKFWTAWPEPPEQTAIADFLDRETGRIDTLVAKKQTLIERLKEKRTALISALVTGKVRVERNDECGMMNDEKGNSDSSFIIPHSSFKMKPSGVEWQGDVPEGWEIGRIGGVFRFLSGGTPSTTHEAYWNGNIPWVSSKDMKHFRVTDTIDHVTMQAVNESATSMLPAGSVLLVVRSGILRHTIPIAVAKCGVAINQDIKGLQPSTERINSLFFSYWVLGNQRTLLTLWRQQGATVESLNVDAVKVTPFPLPPTDEQTAIADFLDRETAKIDQLINKIETAIERLREYRRALITAAVTGKIDVRRKAA